MAEALSRLSRRPVLLALELALAALVAPVAHAHADAACSRRYTISADSTTVTDNDTRLVWQQTSDMNGYTWEQATQYCANLTLDGAIWRLPLVFELQTLVDESRSCPASDPRAFPAMQGYPGYWSTSTVLNQPYAWFVNFGDGSVGYDDISATYLVLCVH